MDAKRRSTRWQCVRCLPIRAPVSFQVLSISISLSICPSRHVSLSTSLYLWLIIHVFLSVYVYHLLAGRLSVYACLSLSFSLSLFLCVGVPIAFPVSLACFMCIYSYPHLSLPVYKSLSLSFLFLSPFSYPYRRMRANGCELSLVAGANIIQLLCQPCCCGVALLFASAEQQTFKFLNPATRILPVVVRLHPPLLL